MTADTALRIPEFVRTHDFSQPFQRYPWHQTRRTYRVFKWISDYSLTLVAFPLLVLVGAVLLLLNPIWNPGPLMYRQERWGHNRRPFHMFKFRTMRPETSAARGALDDIEDHRITPLGRVLRRLRIDELPNFLNVARGEMSVIGPRPDAAHHASIYVDQIPHYADRFRVRPGITGLAQVVTGYAEGLEATSIKARYDQHYVHSCSLRLDLHIAWRTVGVILSGFGAK